MAANAAALAVVILEASFIPLHSFKISTGTILLRPLASKLRNQQDFFFILFCIASSDSTSPLPTFALCVLQVM